MASFRPLACIDLFEDHSENSLKGGLSKDTTVNPPLFSLVNTFKPAFAKRDKKQTMIDLREEPRQTGLKTSSFPPHKAFYTAGSDNFCLA